MPKKTTTMIEDIAVVFDVDLPNDDISSLAPPSYLDIPNGVLKSPAKLHFAYKHACCNPAVSVQHVCHQMTSRPK